jgi:hypothetical protein
MAHLSPWAPADGGQHDDPGVAWVNPWLVNHWLSLHGWFLGESKNLNVGQASDGYVALDSPHEYNGYSMLLYVILVSSTIVTLDLFVKKCFVGTR